MKRDSRLPTLGVPTSDADKGTPREAIAQLFTASTIEAHWFNVSFLTQVPIPKLEQVIAAFKERLGAYIDVTGDPGEYVVLFERGAVPTRASINSKDQITGLLFQPPRVEPIPLDDVVAGFRSLRGQVSLLIRGGRHGTVRLNADEPLAVASGYKLAVLAALRHQIDAGAHSWHEVVELQPGWQSLPSGILQDWPDGSPLTLYTLAALMISQSDNTAGDALIRILGRDTVEHYAPRNRPFLTSREAFILKNPINVELLERYRQGSDQERLNIVNDIDRYALPHPDTLSANQKVLDVEWFFTADELCNLMDQVADLSLMSINKGPIRNCNWPHISYKGGSEPGVLSLVARLTDLDGSRLCLAVTINSDLDIDRSKFLSLYAQLMQAIEINKCSIDKKPK